MPVGGVAGESLLKSSGVDYDTEWGTPEGVLSTLDDDYLSSPVQLVSASTWYDILTLTLDAGTYLILCNASCLNGGGAGDEMVLKLELDGADVIHANWQTWAATAFDNWIGSVSLNHLIVVPSDGLDLKLMALSSGTACFVLAGAFQDVTFIQAIKFG